MFVLQVDSLVGSGKGAHHVIVMPCLAVASCLCVSVRVVTQTVSLSDRPATSQETIVTSYGRQQPGGSSWQSLSLVSWSGNLPAFGSRSSHCNGVPSSSLMDSGALLVPAMYLRPCVRPVSVPWTHTLYCLTACLSQPCNCKS